VSTAKCLRRKRRVVRIEDESGDAEGIGINAEG
jgi:hypothetical protein